MRIPFWSYDKYIFEEGVRVYTYSATAILKRRTADLVSTHTSYAFVNNWTHRNNLDWINSTNRVNLYAMASED